MSTYQKQMVRDKATQHQGTEEAQTWGHTQSGDISMPILPDLAAQSMLHEQAILTLAGQLFGMQNFWPYPRPTV